MILTLWLNPTRREENTIHNKETDGYNLNITLKNSLSLNLISYFSKIVEIVQKLAFTRFYKRKKPLATYFYKIVTSSKYIASMLARDMYEALLAN